MPDTEKRSLERHQLEEFVHLDGGKELIPGRTVDVSRNGMKIRVDQAWNPGEEGRVSVNFPGFGGEGIPCLVRRSRQDENFWEIGLEFDGETDARMLLVERWLDSLENRRAETDSAPTESRQVPRTRCVLKGIRCRDASLEVLSAEDISLDGMLLRVNGTARRGDRLQLEMNLEGNGGDITFTGRVAYAAGDGSDGSGTLSLGIAIEEMREVDRNRLRNFIVEIASGAAMREYQRLLERDEPPQEFRIEGKEARDLVSALAESGQTVNLLDESGLRIVETRVDSMEDEVFRAPAPVSGKDGPGPTAFFSFLMEGSSYSFSAERRGWTDGTGRYALPACIYRGEKRAGRRKSDGGPVTIHLPGGGPPVRGLILDSSRRGMLCEIVATGDMTPFLRQGMAVELESDGRRIPGELRHIVENTGEGGERILRMGIETGIRRREPVRRAYTAEEWKSAWQGERRALGDPARVRPRSVEFTDRRGRRIAALLHTNRPDSGMSDCTAVVIPPAFGKKKETLGPLALTILAHFTAAGEPVAVLRYDGIDRPGESENANSHARRGYEMLSYRIDQGYDDLEAGMRWIRNNGHFRVGKVGLVSFSMAALDARRLQSDPNAPGADYWISVMGVSSSQGALRNILGGLDVIANYRMGLPIGTMGMLGQLIDMDRMAADMTRLGYAVAADARWAMSRVKSPVTWIFGSHDKWMIPEEIRDVMSVEAPGMREIIEIPTAHNLRTSDDAISAFMMISDAMLRHLKGSTVPPVAPDKGELLDLLTRERERITSKETLDAQRYWKGYLVGEQDGEEGYDFYRRLEEFREFLTVQVDLLDPRPGESLADLGCGTGLVSEAILSRLAEAAGDAPLEETRFTGIDLVPEALVKAEEKYNLLCRSHPRLKNIDTRWISMDLEPDALAGIRNCAGRRDVGIDDLRDRVKGLGAETADRIALLPPEIAGAWLGGREPGREMIEACENGLHPADSLILGDLNRAARFVLGNLTEEDLKPSRRRGTGPVAENRLETLRTSDLHTAVLDFGDWGRDGRLPVEDGTFDAVSASLFLSYLFAPGEAVKEFARMLRPGGRLVLSTMKPDSDISTIFTRYIAEQSALDAESAKDTDREKNLSEARSMLNEAAALFSLEEDGWFRFFDTGEMVEMMRNAGFSDIRVCESLGKPEQAVILRGIKKNV